MSEERPVWRQGYDALERAVAPRLEMVVRTDQFAIAVGLAQKVQQSMRHRAERTTRRMLHLLNLPAGSDVNRILAELGQLQRQVRELAKQANDFKEPPSGSRDDGPQRPGRPRQARR